MSSLLVLQTMSRRGNSIYFFNYWNAISDSYVHSKALFFLRILKNNKHLFANFETNLLRAATHLVNYCTSRMFLNELIMSIAWIWSKFTLIPLLGTRKSRNFSMTCRICIWKGLTSCNIFKEYQTFPPNGQCDQMLKALDQHVINVDFHCFSNHLLEHPVDQSLVRLPPPSIL